MHLSRRWMAEDEYIKYYCLNTYLPTISSSGGNVIIPPIDHTHAQTPPNYWRLDNIVGNIIIIIINIKYKRILLSLYKRRLAWLTG